MHFLRVKCKNKDQCSLKRRCKAVPLECSIPISGKIEVDILFLGEAPGKDEELQGRPFIGKSGSILRVVIDRIIQDYGNFTYAISNVVKTRPTKDGGETRVPSKDEVSCCQYNLLRDLKYVKPKVIVALGATAHEFLHKQEKFSIFMECGCIREVKLGNEVYKTISTLHPAWIIRQKESTCVGFILNETVKALMYARKNILLNIPNKFKSILIDNVKDVKELFTMFRKTNKPVAIDTECRNLFRVYNNSIISSQFSNDGKTGYLIPWSHFDSPFDVKNVESVKNLHKAFFTKSTKVPLYIYQNPKYDMHQFFRELGVIIYNSPITDVGYNEYLLEENWSRFQECFPKGKGPLSLFTISYKYGFTFYKDSDSKEDRANLESMPIKDWLKYGCADVVTIWNIWNSQNTLAKIQGYKKFNQMAVEYHNRMIRTLTYTEHCGLPTSLDKIRFMYSPSTSPLLAANTEIKQEFMSFDSVKNVVKKLRKNKVGMGDTLFKSDKIYFDPSKRSHQEMLFFDELNLEPVKDDKLSCDKDFQKLYKDSIPEVKLLADFNRVKILYNQQVKSIYEFMNKSTGNPDFFTDIRIRPSFAMTTVTGRSRTTSPNTQQRVSHGDRAESILQMYESKPGKIIIKIDYSTFEVRGLQFISKDKSMLKSFLEMNKMKRQFRKDRKVFAEKGYDILKTSLKTDEKLKEDKKELKKALSELAQKYKVDPIYFSLKALDILCDIHRRSASMFFKVALEKVSKVQRQNAKNFVFGSIYGMSVNTIAQRLGISLEEAKKIYNLFMQNMPEAVGWLTKTQKNGQTNLWVESPIGRRRRLWGYLIPKNVNSSVYSKMNRLAMNSPIQGVCSDMNLLAVSILIEFIFDCGKGKYQVPDELAWLICNLIHDSAELEVPVEDTFFVLTTFEKFFTKILLVYLNEKFGFKIDVPIEVDFEVGPSMAVKKKWDGSIDGAKELHKWAMKEIYARDKKKLTKSIYKESLRRTYGTK